MTNFELTVTGKGRLVYFRTGLDEKWKICNFDSCLEGFISHGDSLLAKCLSFEHVANTSDFPITIYHQSNHSKLSNIEVSVASLASRSSYSNGSSQFSMSMSSSNSSNSGSSSSAFGSTMLSSSKHFWTAFLPGVGWALRSATDQPANILIQFCDGNKLLIAPDCASVEFTDNSSVTTHYPIDGNTPSFVRAKLEHLPAFFSQMKQIT